jgi:uncharacterized protein YgfB (UPF0149 family)
MKKLTKKEINFEMESMNNYLQGWEFGFYNGFGLTEANVKVTIDDFKDIINTCKNAIALLEQWKKDGEEEQEEDDE